MPRFRVTLGFLKHTMGPTETYISPVLSLPNATAAVQALITKRNAMLPNVVQWTGVRISQEGVKRRSVFYPPGSYFPFVEGQSLVVPATGTATVSQVAYKPDQTRACLHMRLTYDTDKRVIRYFNFPPDGITVDEPNPIDFGANVAYGIFLDTFWNHLKTTSWAIKGRRSDAGYTPIDIVDWVQAAAAPQNLGIVLPNLPAPGLNRNDKVTISGVKRRGFEKSSYNGTYIIHSVNTTLVPDSIVYYLRGTEGGDPTSIKLMGKVQKLGYDYHAIQGFEAVRVGVHKRGKPLGSPSGRRVKRVSLNDSLPAAQ